MSEFLIASSSEYMARPMQAWDRDGNWNGNEKFLFEADESEWQLNTFVTNNPI